MSNFAFLQEKFPVLANLGNLAEKYLYNDPNSCLIKLGMIGETIVNLIFEYDDIIKPTEDKAVNRINILIREGIIDEQITDILHALRKARNKAVHENYEGSCGVLLSFAYTLCEWFMQTYGDYKYTHTDFVLPTKAMLANDALNLITSEQKIDELTNTAIHIATKTKAIQRDKRLELITNANANLKLTEEQTRYLIDEKLRLAGWQADTQTLRYSKGTRPTKNKNLAIAEWPVITDNNTKGRVDYALFIGEKLVGIVEAKRLSKDISSVLDYQCKEYARGIIAKDEYLVGNYETYKVPFIFATNGREYLKQIETASGIWYQDLRNKLNSPIALKGFKSPNGLRDLLENDIQKSNEELQDFNQGFLVDKQGLNLRYYQVNAIKATVDAVLDGQKNILLAMATGTGKTRTILGMIYLFLKTKRFNRILFLVDRTSLGEQAYETFREVKLEELLTLDEIYNIKGLNQKIADRETKIQIATVQSMVRRLLYQNDTNENTTDKSTNDYKDTISVSDYDLIIVDEAHRGYVLDRQMSEEELLYNNQQDYISKYRYVIEYFDAIKIGLTATPALHTTEIFGKPIFTYSYREAVNDRFLVDHDVPHTIRTKLSTQGIVYHKGDDMTLYNTETKQIRDVACLEDEVHIEIDKFNKDVIVEDFNRKVLTEIIEDICEKNTKKDIEPQNQGKVLIFAVNDMHADLIVKILKEICPNYAIDSDTIMKITASAGDGKKERILEYIRRFKNEQDPSIVVTVDLLTTGIDVPKIDTLVFLRRVKSRILFEQMLGRATRLCPEIGKTCFDIYDPVGVYEALDSVNTMKPVAVNPKITIQDIIKNLTKTINHSADINDNSASTIETVQEDKTVEYNVNNIADFDYKKNQIGQLVAKLNRRQQAWSDELKKQFKTQTGKSTTEFIDELKEISPENIANYLLNRQSWLEILTNNEKSSKEKTIYQGEDEVISVERNYGNTEKPEDYIESFTQYLKTNLNEIMALKLICTKPSDLKRDELIHLKNLLMQHRFSETHLNTAINAMTNQEITADIISIIRQCILGSARISHEERIKNAMQKLKANHNFSTSEQAFLKNIEKYLLKESIITKETFNNDRNFKSRGGFNTINKRFGGQLENIIKELNQYLYDDGGKIA